MIFFTAINDIKEGSKFFNSIVKISKTKNDLIWGITELSKSTFEKINKDDYILFYNKSAIIGIGQVLVTKTDKNLSIDLFGTYNHKYKGILHWSNLLYLSKFHPVKIEFDFFKKIGGYSPKFSVRKLIGLNQTGSDKIIDSYNSYENFIIKIIKEYGTQQKI